MSQDTEKYFYFTVGLLKNSFALDALRRDALKYHMIDQPDQLIALRLTEYYELMAGGILPAGIGAPLAKPPTLNGTRDGREEFAPANSIGIDGSDSTTNGEHIVATSPDIDQNADDAAEYWAQL